MMKSWMKFVYLFRSATMSKTRGAEDDINNQQINLARGAFVK